MLHPEDLLAAGFAELSEDDGRLQRCDETTAAPVDPQLEVLPTGLMHWTQFERLLLRVAREVRGLRSVSLLGNSGQKQEGLDVIGLDGAGQAEGIQSKKYVRFTKADLDAAVIKFDEGSLPFSVPRLVIGVACSGHEAKVVARLMEINQDRDDLEVEIWDIGRLSEMLRDRPEIVREFFGAGTAASFCVPHVMEPVVVPAPDAVSLASAVLGGPASATGAREKLAAADEAEPQNLEASLALVRAAQAALDEAGFPAHAQVLDERVVGLLLRLGRRTDAARLLLDRLWSRLAADQSDDAAITLRTLEGLDGPPEADVTESGDGPAPDPFVPAAIRTGRRALAVYGDPFGRTDADAIDNPDRGYRSTGHASCSWRGSQRSRARGSQRWHRSRLSQPRTRCRRTTENSPYGYVSSPRTPATAIGKNSCMRPVRACMDGTCPHSSSRATPATEHLTATSVTPTRTGQRPSSRLV
ncbi:MAG: hypothetical protein H0V64_03935 [Geodermatophilaceae bacterium]|nr:hypothetical protein [Geodermatophilaceae bacterium]